MAIIVSKSGKNAQKLNKSGVESEDYLQKYIYDNPESLPLDEYKEDLQLLILAREFPTESGPIDALGVDQDGEIYLIETKLYKNPDKRLVLAQVLDYGASLWRNYSDPNEFIVRLQELVAKHFDTSLEEKLRQKFESVQEDWDTDTYLSDLRSTVDSGSFRYVVLMDHIEDRLKDLITYMNQNSRFDLFGVELEFYRHENLEILIPKLFGNEVKKSVGSSGSDNRRNWDETKFFEDAGKRLNTDEVKKLKQLHAWSKDKADQVSWGTGVQRGSFNPKFDHISPKSVFTVFSDGTLQLNFSWLGEPEATSSFAKKLGARIREDIPEFTIPEEFMSEHINIQIEEWSSHLSKLLNIFEEVLLESA